MIIYDLNDAQRAESIYFETKEKAVLAGAGICYERYKGDGSLAGFINHLNDEMKYKDITIERVIVY